MPRIGRSRGKAALLTAPVWIEMIFSTATFPAPADGSPTLLEDAATFASKMKRAETGFTYYVIFPSEIRERIDSKTP